MRPELSQSQLADYQRRGKLAILQYRTAYRIECAGKRLELRRTGRKAHGLPYTARGRFIACSELQARQLLESN